MYLKIFSICALLAITEAVKIKVDVRMKQKTIFQRNLWFDCDQFTYEVEWEFMLKLRSCALSFRNMDISWRRRRRVRTRRTCPNFPEFQGTITPFIMNFHIPTLIAVKC